MPTSEYIAYLQKLLKQANIEFILEDAFLKKEIKSEKKDEIPQKSIHLLQHNIKEPLVGNLINRYSRQMLLKDIAYDGQLRITNSKVAIIGSGGIGCPLALYLAGAGVGVIGLFDSDVVDTTNLHRQIGHKSKNVGVAKTTSLKNTLLELNEHIQVLEYPAVTSENVQILSNYDLVIDGSDNPQCRYIVNDYCMQKGVFLLSGACIGWEAQVTCYGGDAACYRCIWGDDQVSLGGCSTLGVIGPIPGFVGILLATQAIKMLTKEQSSLSGFLLTFEAKKCELKKLKLRGKKAECQACGVNKLNIKEYDYSRYGTCNSGSNPLPKVLQKSWQEYIQDKSKPLIIDVRPNQLYDIVHLNNSVNIPYEKLSQMSKESILLAINSVNQNEIPVSCTRGIMSRYGAEYLGKLNLKAYSIVGGLNEYSKKYDSNIPLL